MHLINVGRNQPSIFSFHPVWEMNSFVVGDFPEIDFSRFDAFGGISKFYQTN